MAIDFSTDIGRVRLLLNDVDEANKVFTDPEIQAFLDLEAGSVKAAAASAIDAQATNEALAAKVLRTQDVSTDGAKVADALRKHADRLRAQADDEDAGYFEIIDQTSTVPELSEWPLP